MEVSAVNQTAALNKQFARVLFGACAITVLYVLVTYLITMKARRNIFRGTFMKKFADEHQKAFNVPKAPELGYPDTGNGRFSKQLNYFSWFKFNNA